jgi:acetyl esterase/lipase
MSRPVSRSRIRYGHHRSQVGDLWLPADHLPPVVVLIHGGFWRSLYTKMLMNRLAKAVTQRGWAAWNIEYRRVGTLGGGGGWPATLADVVAAIGQLEGTGAVDCSRVVTCGHSAGGQLALWATARARFPELCLSSQEGVEVLGAVSLAGVVDLVEADRLRLGGDAVSDFLGGHFADRPERYRSASPLELLPLGVRQILIHGADDTVVPLDLDRRYRSAAVAAGDPVELVEVPGGDHRSLIAPAATGAVVLDALGRLLS